MKLGKEMSRLVGEIPDKYRDDIFTFLDFLREKKVDELVKSDNEDVVSAVQGVRTIEEIKSLISDARIEMETYTKRNT